MKILIVGAGVIGINLAKSLSEENHEVTLIEKDEDVALRVKEKLDCNVIFGEGADPQTLQKAGVETADLVIAVTTSDEANLVVCSIASVYGKARKIARVRSDSLNRMLKEFGPSRFHVDEVIFPEQETAESIVQVMKAPGASDVADFADGKILLRSFDVPDNSPLCGIQLKELNTADFPWPFIIVAIYRDSNVMFPTGETTITASDRIFVLLPKQSLGEFLTFVNPNVRKPNRVIICGATDIGERVAEILTDEVRDIILLEEDEEKAQDAAGRLSSVRVTKGSASEADILKECGIEAADAFIATSTNDHLNLVSAVLAKKMGAKTTIISTQHPDYMAIIDAMDIDAVVNPRFIAVDQILRIVRGKIVTSVTKLLEGNAEAIELIPEKGSPVTKAALKDIRFPKNAIVGAVSNESEAQLAQGDTKILPGDKVIIFCKSDAVGKLQKLFSHNKLL